MKLNKLNEMIRESKENDKILSQILADKIKSARNNKYPSAESLVNIPIKRIIVK